MNVGVCGGVRHRYGAESVVPRLGPLTIVQRYRLPSLHSLAVDRPTRRYSMRKATTVKPVMWRKWKRSKLPPNVRLVFSFLLSGEDTNLSGLVTYSLDEICGFTGLPAKAVRRSLVFLVDTNRIMWDEDHDLILLLRWIKHNPLNNSKLESGAMNSISAYENHPFYKIAVSLISGASPDRVSTGYTEGMHTSQGQGQGSSLNSERKVKAHEAAVLVCNAFNVAVGTNRSPSKSLLHLCNGLIDDGHSPEDIGKVARFRCCEDWVGSGNVPESLVRKTEFESYLQAADEAPENKPQAEVPYNADFFKEN